MRLFDQISAQNPEREYYITGEKFKADDLLRDSVRYRIDNVSLYYWQHSQTYWDIAEPAHFPSLAPPHPIAWLEYKMPTRFIMETGERYAPELAKEYVGCLVIAHDRRAGTISFDAYSDDTRWVLEGHMFLTNRHTAQPLQDAAHGFILPVAGDGSIGAYKDRERGPFAVALSHQLLNVDDNGIIMAAVAQHAKPYLLTFSFLACNNVLIVDHDPRPPRKGGRRKTRRKPTQYRTLEIRPLKDVLRLRGKKRAGSGRKMSSVSITRGHFRTYTEAGKLFGKYTGTFWIPAHVKGRGRAHDRDREIKI